MILLKKNPEGVLKVIRQRLKEDSWKPGEISDDIFRWRSHETSKGTFWWIECIENVHNKSLYVVSEIPQR